MKNGLLLQPEYASAAELEAFWHRHSSKAMSSPFAKAIAFRVRFGIMLTRCVTKTLRNRVSDILEEC